MFPGKPVRQQQGLGIGRKDQQEFHTRNVVYRPTATPPPGAVPMKNFEGPFLTYEDRLCFLTRSPGDVKGTGGRCLSGKIKQHLITKAAYCWGWAVMRVTTHAPPSLHSLIPHPGPELPSTELTLWTWSEISCGSPPYPLSHSPWAGPGQGFLPGISLLLGASPVSTPSGRGSLSLLSPEASKNSRGMKAGPASRVWPTCAISQGPALCLCSAITILQFEFVSHVHLFRNPMDYSPPAPPCPWDSP